MVRRLLIPAFVAALMVLSGISIASSQNTIARPPSPSEELNTLLMHATFLISGPQRGQPGVSFGTVFIMGVPHKDDPKIANIVLVTAGHVLDNIGTDQASLNLRRRGGEGTYVGFAYSIPIRENGRPLYVKHGTADVAVMYADLPDEVPITGLPPEFLADDKRLEDIDLHPGDEAFVLGLPLAASGAGAFPILRTGHIISYPLTPMRNVKQFGFDIFIYGGNSGGPVYYSYVNRFFKGQLHFGLVQGILGLVIQEVHSSLPGFADKALNYGIVVPAAFIRETIEMLPPPKL
jgi:hypothetical protein